ncbi:MAG: C4-dicarboxylate ABC transporter substrate-binding protein, partial [Rhodospirillales bacterium]|nr:C4-dicarboxylate ABC transporter substrate-binding protein [Rhodospirillales bacterium]
SLNVLLPKGGAKVSEATPAMRKRWAGKLDDVAGEWAAKEEAKGVPAKALLARYMEGVRKLGGQPLRDWK